jgi:hypothetical protein
MEFPELAIQSEIPRYACYSKAFPCATKKPTFLLCDRSVYLRALGQPRLKVTRLAVDNINTKEQVRSCP